MTAFVICVGSSLLSKTADVTIRYSNKPKDILSGITYYDCHYGPQRHVKEKERYNKK